MANPPYHKSVFINCPFDEQYRPMMEAIVFAVTDCGFVARSAREIDDAGEVRIDKIFRIIKESRFGIHDISRTELCKKTSLPRFNMPLELGFFLGAKRFGNGSHRRKICMVLDREPYRYQKFISDIAGQDIHAHDDDPVALIAAVRRWLSTAVEGTATRIPGGKIIAKRFKQFRTHVPRLCQELSIDPEELTFKDFAYIVAGWLRQQAKS